MIAVGNISILKPNSNSIPIDKDSDTPVYLDEKFRFFIDIEGRKQLIYTVEPLTLYTETKLISELGYALNTQLTSTNEELNDDRIKDVIIRKRNRRLVTDKQINRLIVKYSRCLNPSVLIPSLKSIFSAFTTKDLSKSDYASLYDELVATHIYIEPSNRLGKLFFRRESIRKLRLMNMEEILKTAKDVIDAYTLGMLANQDIYTRIKVLINIIRYEREFKKKLLLLFSKDQTTAENRKINRDLDKLTLLYETNVDIAETGQGIPVF